MSDGLFAYTITVSTTTLYKNVVSDEYVFVCSVGNEYSRVLYPNIFRMKKRKMKNFLDSFQKYMIEIFLEKLAIKCLETSILYDVFDVRKRPKFDTMRSSCATSVVRVSPWRQAVSHKLFGRIRSNSVLFLPLA